MNSEKGPESLHRAKTEDITKELREQREARGAKKEAIMCLLRDLFEPSEAIQALRDHSGSLQDIRLLI